MKRKLLTLAGVALGVAGCDQASVTVRDTSVIQVAAPTEIEAGRYLVRIGGCNDCHTPGYIQSGGQTPEAEWLKGNNHGFFGPWGTTYAANLRLSTANLKEDDWIEMLRTRKAMPIMPWPSVNAMSEPDRRALYRYIRSLPGEAGEAAPATLPPGQIPTTPYEDLNTKGAPSPQ